MSEPTTAVTDYILALETIFLGALLLRSPQTSTRMWGLAFFFVAMAALTGGTFHGFQQRLAPTAAAALWKITVYSIGLTGFFMLVGAFLNGTSSPWRQWLIGAAVVQLLIYGIWMANHGDFRYVIYNYLPSMTIVLLLQVVGHPHPGSGWIIAGILLSFAGAVVQRSGFTLHRHFNFNDLYHVIQMVAMYLLYRGGLRFSR